MFEGEARPALSDLESALPSRLARINPGVHHFNAKHDATYLSRSHDARPDLSNRDTRPIRGRVAFFKEKTRGDSEL
jgi:hypothetical protein